MTGQDAGRQELSIGERVVHLHQHMHARGYQYKNCPSCRGLVQAIDAAVAEAVKEREAAIIRAYHVTLDALGAPADEWPCNRAKKLADEARREERERADALASVSRRYRNSEHPVSNGERLAMHEAAKELRVRIAALEAALKRIADEAPNAGAMVTLARAALGPPASAPEGSHGS